MSTNFLPLSLKLTQFITVSSLKIQKLILQQISSSNHYSFPNCRIQFVHSLSFPRNPNPNFDNGDFETLCTAIKTPNLINQIEFEPSPSLLLAIFKSFDSSPKEVFSLFKWAGNRPRYSHTPLIFNSLVNILSKLGEFKWALMVFFNEIKIGNGYELVSAESFEILIKNYAKLGMYLNAIRANELANSLKMDLFNVLLDGLCKNGHVKVACDCIDWKICVDPNWVLSMDVYNMLLEGWFRVRNLKMVEQIMLRLRKEKLVPGVGTYGVLVGGFCRMGLLDRAMELISDMRRDGLTPNRVIYDPLIDGLAGAGRLKEALGMLERFLVLEAGPTLTTYDSLLRGFCKAGDLDGAGKVLKMMCSRGIMPTTLTYNHFFRYFLRFAKIDEAVDLYRKIVDSGYEPNGKTYHLMLRMLCEEERLDLILNIGEDMRRKGHFLNLDISHMLIDMFLKSYRFEEAVIEFEELIQRGFVPEHRTYQILYSELKKKGLHEIASKAVNLVAAISCFKPLT